MNQQVADPRVGLAKNRTGMAGFRTGLALDRTTLTMGTFGFGTIGFFRTLREKNPTPNAVREHEGAIAFGIGLVFLGCASTVAAGISHWLTLRRLRRGQTPVVSQWPLSITVAMFLAVIGLISLWYVIPR